MFKKQKWIPYGRKASNIEVNVKDQFNQTIDQIYLEKGKDIDNIRKLKRIKKWGFDLNLPEEEGETIKEIKEKERDWLEKESRW